MKKDFVVSKREFSRVVKVPFEKAFSISNIKADFAKCGIHPFNPNAVKQSIIAPSLNWSSSSADDSSCNSATPCPSSSSSNLDGSLSLSVPSCDLIFSS